MFEMLNEGVNLTLADGPSTTGLCEAVALTDRTAEADVHEPLGRGRQRCSRLTIAPANGHLTTPEPSGRQVWREKKNEELCEPGLLE